MTGSVVRSVVRVLGEEERQGGLGMKVVSLERGMAVEHMKSGSEKRRVLARLIYKGGETEKITLHCMASPPQLSLSRI